jgi:CTP synthase
VMEARDIDSIYKLPLALSEQGLHDRVTSKLHIWTGAPKLMPWEKIVHTIDNPKDKVRIAMVGKYVDLKDSYKSMNEALTHGGIANEVAVEIVHVDSEEVEAKGLTPEILSADGVLVPMGFGPRGTEGKIKTVQYVRENGVPFFGICYGMQMAVIEFARNVCGLEGAHTTEADPNTPHPVIDLMIAQQALAQKGGTMRLGSYPCVIKEGSLAHRTYGKRKISERHRHRYEFNIAYRERIEKGGMVLSGTSPDGELVEMVEIPNHPWFLACQFHPEFKSKPLDPHPMFRGFIKAALAHKQQRHETPPLRGLRVVGAREETEPQT